MLLKKHDTMLMKHYLLGFQIWLLHIPLQTFFGTSDSVTSNNPSPYNFKHLWELQIQLPHIQPPNPHLPPIGYLNSPEPETQNKIGTYH